MFEGFTHTQIDTTGARINLRHGGSGPPLLLLHGNPLTHVMWHKIAPRLAEEFTVVEVDCVEPTPGPESATIAFWLKLAPVMVRVVAPGVRLAGDAWSMNGTASGGAWPNKTELVRNVHTKKRSRDFILDSPNCGPIYLFI